MGVLLRGGTVMDPGAGLTDALDVRVRDGLITEVAAEFLSLGMPLADVIRAVTTAPARVIGRAGKLGTLRPGSVADVAVYALEEGSFDYEDAHGQHITGRQRFVPTLTLRAGEVWWRGGAR